MGGLDPKLLEKLVCPLTKSALIYDAEKQELISEAAGIAYPIRNQIPIMLIDEVRIIDRQKAAQYLTLQGEGS